MTARQVYEGVLIELNKVNAPSLLLEDFNYLFNKAINQYINKRYNIYDVNQQTTDDVRVLKATAILKPTSAFGSTYPSTEKDKAITEVPITSKLNSLYGATYEVILPTDYLHILNCVCNYTVSKQFKCYDADTYVQFAATRLTADMWSQIINNFYMRPSYKRPYYYINNVNTSTNLPTNPFTGPSIESGKEEYGLGKGTDQAGEYSESNPNLTKTIKFGNKVQSSVEKNIANRYGNASTVMMEIRYGKDDTLFKLEEVYIDYIKTPQYIRLTSKQIDLTEDTSQIMEFPDYVCQEIINELVNIVMENSSDPRLQTHIPISTSIANPAQANEQPKK